MVAVEVANVTVLLPFVAPNPVPVIVTGVPRVPEVGEMLVMVCDKSDPAASTAKTKLRTTRDSTRRRELIGISSILSSHP